MKWQMLEETLDRGTNSWSRGATQIKDVGEAVAELTGTILIML